MEGSIVTGDAPRNPDPPNTPLHPCHAGLEPSFHRGFTKRVMMKKTKAPGSWVFFWEKGPHPAGLTGLVVRESEAPGTRVAVNMDNSSRPSSCPLWS